MTSSRPQQRVAAPPSTAEPRRDLGAVALRVVVALAVLTAVLAPMTGNSGPMPVILVGIPFEGRP